jgi:hypothetical protein
MIQGPVLAGQAAAPEGTIYPAANPKGHYQDEEKLPDWGGLWAVQFQRRVAGAPAPEQIQPKGKYKEDLEKERAYQDAHHGEPLREVSYCAPPGTPGIMSVGQYPFEFLFTPGRVTILAEAYTGERRIYTDGRSHLPPDEIEPSFFGDSIGHWEGDTLVVNTIGIKTTTQIAGVGHSDKLVVDERIHLDPANKDVLIDEITSTDPEALEKPYHQTVRYARHRDWDMQEYICENDRNTIAPDGTVNFK